MLKKYLTLQRKTASRWDSFGKSPVMPISLAPTADHIPMPDGARRVFNLECDVTMLHRRKSPGMEFSRTTDVFNSLKTGQRCPDVM